MHDSVSGAHECGAATVAEGRFEEAYRFARDAMASGAAELWFKWFLAGAMAGSSNRIKLAEPKALQIDPMTALRTE